MISALKWKVWGLFARFGLTFFRSADDETWSKLMSRWTPIDAGIPLRRIGSPHDGGYLVPDDLTDLAAILSPGVGIETSFEFHFAKNDVPVYLADASVTHLPIEHPRMNFTAKYVGCRNADETLRFDDWVEGLNLPQDGDLLLQLDVEGSEWEVLATISDHYLKRIRVLIVEFHELHRLTSAATLSLLMPIVDRISDHFFLVHFHPNNCCGSFHFGGVDVPKTAELTFLRRDRALGVGPVAQMSHSLDADCVPGRKLVLRNPWF